jgi:hypothetical protein
MVSVSIPLDSELLGSFPWRLTLVFALSGAILIAVSIRSIEKRDFQPAEPVESSAFSPWVFYVRRVSRRRGVVQNTDYGKQQRLAENKQNKQCIDPRPFVHSIVRTALL